MVNKLQKQVSNGSKTVGTDYINLLETFPVLVTNTNNTLQKFLNSPGYSTEDDISSLTSAITNVNNALDEGATGSN
jgi:hypothetical protein